MAKYCHFLDILQFVRRNGHKMVDFGNEVLINQLDDGSACMLRKLAWVNDVNTVIYSLDPIHSHEYGKN